ncbi:MAG: response regulator [Lysobacterales bacterium]
MGSPINSLLIVEDDPALQSHLRESLADLVSEGSLWACASLADARRLQAINQPELILLDVGLPDGNGLELLVDQHSEVRPARVVILSGFSDEETIVNAIGLGAQGYLLKQDTQTNLRTALVEIVDGKPPLSPSVAQCIMSHIRLAEPAPREEPSTFLPPRQQQTLNLLARGLTYQQIASEMDIAFNTVSTYAQEIYSKLAARSRGEAVHKARELGIL